MIDRTIELPPLTAIEHDHGERMTLQIPLGDINSRIRVRPDTMGCCVIIEYPANDFYLVEGALTSGARSVYEGWRKNQ